MSDDVKPYTREELATLAATPTTKFVGSLLTVRETEEARLAWRRLLATARAGLEDRERMDWLEGVLVGPIPEPPISYDDDTRLWTHEDGRTFATFREALDCARGVRSTPSDEGPARSGRADTEKA